MKHKMEVKQLLDNLDKIHTTELGEVRIKRNLNIECEDVTVWCISKIELEANEIVKRGKNWYVEFSNYEITINATSYTIITAHKR